MSSTRRRYQIRHETRYEYGADVVHSHHLLHLVPRPAPFQVCLEHEIRITPGSHRRVNEVDAFGNPLVRVELAQPHRELQVVSEMQIEVHPRPVVRVLPALAPGIPPAKVAEAVVRAAGRAERMALVGHEPDLGVLAAWLIGASRPVPFKKGGICRIDIARWPPESRGSGQLIWLATPGMLRR